MLTNNTNSIHNHFFSEVPSRASVVEEETSPKAQWTTTQYQNAIHFAAANHGNSIPSLALSEPEDKSPYYGEISKQKLLEWVCEDGHESTLSRALNTPAQKNRIKEVVKSLNSQEVQTLLKHSRRDNLYKIFTFLDNDIDDILRRSFQIPFNINEVPVANRGLTASFIAKDTNMWESYDGDEIQAVSRLMASVPENEMNLFVDEMLGSAYMESDRKEHLKRLALHLVEHQQQQMFQYGSETILREVLNALEGSSDEFIKELLKHQGNLSQYPSDTRGAMVAYLLNEQGFGEHVDEEEKALITRLYQSIPEQEKQSFVHEVLQSVHGYQSHLKNLSKALNLEYLRDFYNFASVYDLIPLEGASDELVPSVWQSGMMEISEPNLIEKIGREIESIVKIIDPNSNLKDKVHNIFANRTAATELIEAYTNGESGQVDKGRLELDFVRLLPMINPDLASGKIRTMAKLMAKQALISAQNTLNVSSANQSMPTRPVAVTATPYLQQDIQIDGMRLRFIDVGPTELDEPRGTLLMVHGHQSRLEEFTNMIPELSKQYRVLAVDLPGSGYSEQPDIDYSLEFYEDTLIHFLDQLNIEKATVAGGSLGGNMSLRLGRRAPERFPNVVSWSPAGVWESKEVLGALSSWDALSGDLYWTMLRYQADHWYHEDMPDRQEMIYESMKYREEVDSPLFRRSTRQIATQQLIDSHRGSGHLNSQPTLMLVGKDDTGLDLGKNAIEFFEELPNGELEVYENTGHSIHDEKPEILARRILEFLNQHYPLER